MTPMVTADEVLLRLPSVVKPLSAEDRTRVEALLSDAESLIRDAFEDAGRDFDIESTIPRRHRAITRVIREMVAAAVIIGPNVGVKRLTSTTGPQSDTVEWETAPAISFSGVMLTDHQRQELGLPTGPAATVHGHFPPAHRLWSDRHDQW